MNVTGTLRALAIVSSALAVASCSDAPTEVSTTTTTNKSYAAPAAEQLNAPIPTTKSSKQTATLMTSTATTSLVLNGSFETNAVAGATSFDDWSVYNAGSGAYFVQTGTTSPISGYTVPSPTAGTYAAMSDQYGPGLHILYQDVTIPAGGADLEFDIFIGNRAGAFYTPTYLNYDLGPNQQFRMDIVDPTATITDLGSNVWANIYSTPVGSSAVTGYNHVSASLDAFAGQTIRLRFTEVDNSLFFQAGIDDVVVHPNVLVDIKPGSSTNPVNLSGNGSIPVAILTEDWFDATEINASTLTLGDDSGTETSIRQNNNGVLQFSLEDVDGDGDTDFVAHFPIATLVSNGDLTSSTTELIINGTTANGTFTGADNVTITP